MTDERLKLNKEDKREKLSKYQIRIVADWMELSGLDKFVIKEFIDVFLKNMH